MSYKPAIKKLDYYEQGGGTDEKVKYDAADPTAGYVADKIIAGDGISVAEGTGGSENKLVITNSDKGSDVDLSNFITDISGQDLSTADNTTSAFITLSDIPAMPTRDSLGIDTDDTVTFANLSGENTGDNAPNSSSMPINGGTFTGAAIAADHGTASTAQLVNVCYGTGAAPTASTTPEGTLYVTYTA